MIIIPDPIPIGEGGHIPSSGASVYKAAIGVMDHAINDLITYDQPIYDNSAAGARPIRIPAPLYSYNAQSFDITPGAFRLADYWRRVIYGK